MHIHRVRAFNAGGMSAYTDLVSAKTEVVIIGRGLTQMNADSVFPRSSAAKFSQFGVYMRHTPISCGSFYPLVDLSTS